MWFFYFFCWNVDIDECLKNGSFCDENVVCFNEDGLYNCICKNGFIGSGIVKVKNCF